MDNLTHSLFALTLARTPLARAGRGTTAALLLASNAPDSDIIAITRGTTNYLAWHRGPTHGPLGVVGLGILVALLVKAGQQLNRTWRDRWGDEVDAPFPLLAAISILGVLLHVLMDVPTSYGTRFLTPFDWHWFAVDWMPIIDAYLLVILGAGLLFGRSSADARRRNAAIGLVLMAANYGIRGTAHHRALTLAPRLFGPTLPRPCDPRPARPLPLDSWPHRPPPSLPSTLASPDGSSRCLVEIAAIPTMSPFGWVIIAQMSNAYELHDLDLLDTRFREPAHESEVFWRQVVRYPNIWTPAVEQAARTRVCRVFLSFARFPAARSAVDAQGVTTVRMTDMRFVPAMAPVFLPLGGRQRSLFTAVVRLDAHGQVVSEGLGR